MNPLDAFAIFCAKQHDDICNQKYADMYPYSLHLSMVFAQVLRFEKLLRDQYEQQTAYNAAWGHDLIEDARVSYNDIVKLSSSTATAEVIFLCTENKGRNRDERKNLEFYKALSQNRVAVYVKLCDILANSLFSLSMNSSMFKKYKKEWEEKVYPFFLSEQGSGNIEAFKPIFIQLNQLYAMTD